MDGHNNIGALLNDFTSSALKKLDDTKELLTVSRAENRSEINKDTISYLRQFLLDLKPINDALDKEEEEIATAQQMIIRSNRLKEGIISFVENAVQFHATNPYDSSFDTDGLTEVAYAAFAPKQTLPPVDSPQEPSTSPHPSTHSETF